MMKIEFQDREKEIKAIKKILEREPSLITFIYGPINSGKTELMCHVAEQQPEEYAVFYINLRGRFLRSHEEFLDVLFEIDEERGEGNAKEYAKAILKDLKLIGGIPIPLNLFEKMLERKERSKDVFKYIENFMAGIARKYVPVLIIDELQVIGDVKVDDLLTYKLFNFFVRLTKELHLCHIFAVTSDSVFIERVYNEAMLQGRCRYLLVDDFDYDNTMGFLGRYEFSDKEKEDAWHYCGGKPVYLVELINHKLGFGDVKEKAVEDLKVRITQLKDLLDELTYVRPVVEIAGEEYRVEKEKVTEILKLFKDKESVDFELYRPAKHFLVKKNVLFVDPKEGTVRPQSRLDLLAMRAVVKEV